MKLMPMSLMQPAISVSDWCWLAMRVCELGVWHGSAHQCHEGIAFVLSPALVCGAGAADGAHAGVEVHLVRVGVGLCCRAGSFAINKQSINVALPKMRLTTSG